MENDSLVDGCRAKSSIAGGNAAAVLLFAICGLLAVLPVGAESAFNAHSAVGLNLNGISYWTAEQPFLNIFKTTGVSPRSVTGWVTSSRHSWDTHEEKYLQVDANGYPTTLQASDKDPHKPQLFDQITVLLLRALPKSNAGLGVPYRAGRYVVLYDGRGTIQYEFDAKLISAAPGRDVIEVAHPTGNGIGLYITATDPRHDGDYIRNIRVVYARDEARLTAGHIFRLGFLREIKRYRDLRFMDWLETNNNPLRHWSDRPRVSNGGWGSQRGVPVEVAIHLCNAIRADCWLNVPHKADDNYILQMAMLTHRLLGKTQAVYVEFSNEVWNYLFAQAAYARAEGKRLWPSASGFQANRDWYGMRTAQMCDIWKGVWGSDAARVHCVLSGQTVSPRTAIEALNCPLWTGPGHAPCASHHIDDVAITWYFGFQIPGAWAAQNRVTQLNDLFAELEHGGLISGKYPGGVIKQSLAWEAAYAKAMRPYHLPLVGYEGGSSFVAGPVDSNDSWKVKLYIAANRDPRMREAYLLALSDWRSNGGHLLNQFVDIAGPGKYGDWGALESYIDTIQPITRAPPKWQALQRFIANSPCWWLSCAAPVALRPNDASTTGQ